ncbi:MAG: HAD family phosphatase [Clostridia bacterium]|nr:HAD family phosphatase [Clostridia bacterium]
MKYKLFISDYDGTLGEAPKNDVDKETLSAINAFIDKGGVFCVCSGREYRSISKICREQGLKGLVVSFQGACVHDLESGKCLLDGGLDKSTVIKLIDEVRYTGLSPVIYTVDGFYIEENNPYTDYYERAVGMKGIVMPAKEAVEKAGKSCKVGWLGNDQVVTETAKRLNEKYKGAGVKFNSGAKSLLEAINPEYSKGKAVRFLANYYNIPLEQVIAVGDSTNDIDLITGEWHGVAVGDGKQELKAVAKEITLPFKEKPIKHLIEKYCL